MAATTMSRSYELRFEHRTTYLYVHVKGDRNCYEISRQYWAEILAMVHRRRYHHVLILKDILEALSLIDAFMLIADVAHSGYSDVEFAIVDEHHHVEENVFEELVGNNRGMRLKIFENVEAAEGWLSTAIVPLKTTRAESSLRQQL